MIVYEVEAPTGVRERCYERCAAHGIYSWLRMPGSDLDRPCWTCETERRQIERERRRRARSVRTPPRPPFEKVADTCSLCGTSPLPGRRTSWCSDDCVDLWYVATSGDSARHHLVALHGHECWSCGAVWQPGPTRPSWYRTSTVGPPAPQPVQLFVDHVRPLWSLTDQQRNELRWWLPFNLQLLCGRCHGDKTAREAAERAELRRARS